MDGICADQGCTIETSTTTNSYSNVGDFKVTIYSQGVLETKEDEPCCVVDACVAPLVKYHSVDVKQCMNPSNFGIYKICEKN